MSGIYVEFLQTNKKREREINRKVLKRYEKLICKRNLRSIRKDANNLRDTN